MKRVDYLNLLSDLIWWVHGYRAGLGPGAETELHEGHMEALREARIMHMGGEDDDELTTADSSPAKLSARLEQLGRELEAEKTKSRRLEERRTEEDTPLAPPGQAIRCNDPDSILVGPRCGDSRCRSFNTVSVDGGPFVCQACGWMAADWPLSSGRKP